MFKKFKFRGKEFTRWVVFTFMLFMVFGFASRSIFRLFRAESRYTNVSYDSNLHDKSGYQSKPKRNSEFAGNDINFEIISTDLGQVKNLIKAGENEKSLAILKNDEIIASAHATDNSNPFHTKFERIGNEIVGVEKNLQQGKSQTAIKRIETLIETIKERL